MAETAVAPNNKPVAFGKKVEREMSWTNDGIRSSSSGKNPAGTVNTAPMKIGAKKASKAGRKKVKRAIRRGMVSENAAKKHLGDY